MAPWPLRSYPTAERHFTRLLERAPNNRRNRYYRGVLAFRQERWRDAIGFFESALEVPCVGHTQLDFCDFMTAEARRGVAQAADKLDLLHQQQRDQQAAEGPTTTVAAGGAAVVASINKKRGKI